MDDSSPQSGPTVDDQPNRRPFQFSLRKLLLWSVVWALYLGVVRLIGMHWLVGTILAAYLALLVTIRIKWGYERGSLIAVLLWVLPIGCAGAIFLIGQLVRVRSLDEWAGFLAGWSLACLVGVLLGFYSSLLAHVVVGTVDWIDNVMRTKPPLRAQTALSAVPDHADRRAQVSCAAPSIGDGRTFDGGHRPAEPGGS